MKLFKRHQGELTGRQQAIAERVAGIILHWQRRMADYLNGKTSGLSSQKWLWLLSGFCLVIGAYCLYLLLQVF